MITISFYCKNEITNFNSIENNESMMDWTYTIDVYVAAVINNKWTTPNTKLLESFLFTSILVGSLNL